MFATVAVYWISGCLVGMAGFEPTTSSSRTTRSTKLSHIPERLEPQTGIEPVTSSLPMKCSTAELLRREVKEYTRDIRSHIQ